MNWRSTCSLTTRAFASPRQAHRPDERDGRVPAGRQGARGRHLGRARRDVAVELVAQRLREFQPQATFDMVPGAGHWVQYEAADLFNRRLRARLQPLKLTEERRVRSRRELRGQHDLLHQNRQPECRPRPRRARG